MIPSRRREHRHRVVVLAVPPVIPFDLSIPAQILSGVESPVGVQAYELLVATPTGQSVPTAAGYGVVPQGGLELLTTADTVVVAGSHAPGLREDGVLDPVVGEALRGAAAHARIVALCTGSFLLAAAGLLDGRRATTHWLYAERFAHLFPDVDLSIDALFVEHDDILTSAGGAASIDLCLHLIREDHGSVVANRVGRLNVVAPLREGGQAQFIERPVREDAGTSTAATRAHMLATLGDDHLLHELARSINMSVRTYTRRFRQETGSSPGEWIIRARLDHARHLLEATELSVEDVARAAGFGTNVNLRKRMIAVLGVTPSRYRRNYRRPPALSARMAAAPVNGPFAFPPTPGVVSVAEKRE